MLRDLPGSRCLQLYDRSINHRLGDCTRGPSLLCLLLALGCLVAGLHSSRSRCCKLMCTSCAGWLLLYSAGLCLAADRLYRLCDAERQLHRPDAACVQSLCGMGINAV